MNINIMHIVNARIDASLHNSIKIMAFYFMLIFSVLVIALFPLYVKGPQARTARWLLTSLTAGLILYLVYIIYVTGGFHA